MDLHVSVCVPMVGSHAEPPGHLDSHLLDLLFVSGGGSVRQGAVRLHLWLFTADAKLSSVHPKALAPLPLGAF